MKNYQILLYTILIFYSTSCTKENTTLSDDNISTPSLSKVSVDFIEKRADGPSAIASVINDGGAAIIQKGIIWGTAPNLNISSSNKIISQSGDSAMRESIRGMAMNKTYYIKAFATNVKGTSYSNEISLKIPVDITWRDSSGLVIFYIFKEGDNGYVNGEIHGLMTSGAPAISRGIFECTNSITGTSTLIGTGYSNTEKIISKGSSCNSIGKKIVELNVTKPAGYSDWFIPSRDEFLKMREFNFKYKLLIPGTDTNDFWTSSEVDATRAYAFYTFKNGITEIAKTGYQFDCIPIRAF